MGKTGQIEANKNRQSRKIRDAGKGREMSARTSNFRSYYERKKKENKKYTKKDACEEYLGIYKSITPLEALDAFGSMRLAAIISELRSEGMNITTEIHHKGRDSYAEYRLEGEYEN